MKRCARACGGWTLPSKGRKCRDYEWKSDRVKRGEGVLLVRCRYAACREFFFYGTATQVRRKRCCGCLSRRNLLQRHVTSSLEGKKEREGNATYTERLAHVAFCAWIPLCVWQRISSTALLALRPTSLQSCAGRRRRGRNCCGERIKHCYISDYFHILIARFFAMGWLVTPTCQRARIVMSSFFPRRDFLNFSLTPWSASLPFQVQ